MQTPAPDITGREALKKEKSFVQQGILYALIWAKPTPPPVSHQMHHR